MLRRGSIIVIAYGVLCGGTSLSRWADGALVWRVPMPAAHLQVAGPRFVVGNTDSWKFVVGDVETGQFTTLTQPASDRFQLTATGRGSGRVATRCRSS